MGIRFEVTTEPEFTIEELALQLAEALHGGINAKRDADSFANQMQVETRKIAELEFLIRQVESFHKNPPEKISRMEPLATYSLESLNEQINESKHLRSEWAERQTECLKAIQKYKETEARLQKELTDRRKSK